MTAIAHMVRVACALVVATALCASGPSRAQDTAATDNPQTQIFADQFAAGCHEMIATSMPESIRNDVGEGATAELIAEMIAVGRAGICECFVDALRRQPDSAIGASVMEKMEPQFDACMAAALKPRMARICTEAQRSGADDTAPDCACLADAVAALDDDALGAGANDLFDVLDSTRDIPGSAGAVGEAARGCARLRGPDDGGAQRR